MLCLCVCVCCFCFLMVFGHSVVGNLFWRKFHWQLFLTHCARLLCDLHCFIYIYFVFFEIYTYILLFSFRKSRKKKWNSNLHRTIKKNSIKVSHNRSTSKSSKINVPLNWMKKKTTKFNNTKSEYRIQIAIES